MIIFANSRTIGKFAFLLFDDGLLDFSLLFVSSLNFLGCESIHSSSIKSNKLLDYNLS